MADRSILYRLRAALQGGFVAVAQEVELSGSLVGVLSGTNNARDALQRIDGTGVGSAIFRFTGGYTANNANIDDWFGGRALNRLRCTEAPSGVTQFTFQLPGSTALTTAFDQLVTAGLPERLRFVIEYTGASTSRMTIRAATSPAPQIQGTSSIIVREGVAAELEITRTSGTISNYTFVSIGGVAGDGNLSADSIKLINPATAVWDASENGTLPTVGVVKGNAYRVVNAPSDGSGRFDEVMQNNDWVVWEAEAFSSWAATPHGWFVLPSHEVRRITALERDFLTDIETTPVGQRNSVTRGANYADSVAEIRFQIYATRAAYDPADLNTMGDIDEYTDASDQTGFLGIRLPGSQSVVASDLPNLYVYSERSGEFTRLFNLDSDFSHMGDFSGESDYLSLESFNYSANDVLRIYFGTVVDRYSNPSLDIFESNLSDAVVAKLNRTDPGGNVDEQRLAAVESKVAALFPLTPDVSDLLGWADIFNPEATTQAVNIADGYSLFADYRGAATRYESAGVTYDDTGTNVVTYTGLGNNLYRTFGMKVDGPADQVLLWIVDGAERIPFVDMTITSGDGRYRVNNYTAATTEDQPIRNQIHDATATGQTTLRPGTADTATATIQPFPENATERSRVFNINFDVLLNGADTFAGHIEDVEIPADDTAQAERQIQASANLGPLHGNRTVTFTYAYSTRVSGSDLLIDIRIVSAPSDITFSIDSLATELNYTAPVTTPRVDNFVTLGDGLGDYTFTGENELLLTFHPFQANNRMDVVPAAIDNTGTVDELNNRTLPIPEHTFESVEIPDQTTFTGYEFRTFSPEHFLAHSDLAHLLTRRTVQWCYGLAELQAVTEHAVSEVIDFTAGIVLISPNSTRYLLTVDNNGTLKTEVAP